MNSRNLGILCLTAVLLLAPGHLRAETRFTYQGRLGSAGQPAHGAHDFAFRLFDAETSGTQVGTEQAVSSHDVDQGVFSVQLDFGDAPFNAAPRWLEIRVRASGGGAYTTLSPRQRIGAAPFAIETLFVAPGAVDTIALQDNAVTTAKLADASVTSSKLGSSSVVTGKLGDGAVTRAKLGNNSVGAAQIEDASIGSADIQPDAIATGQIQDNAITTQKIANGNIFTDDLANFAVGTAKLSNQAVTRLKIADNAIGTSQIEDDVVTSADIRDGTITPDDIDGGLYARKTQVLYYTTQAAVSVGKVAATVSCADSNDIPVVAVCNPLLTLSALRLVSERISDFGSDAGPATLQCRMVNDNPSVPEAFEATIGCVAVP